MSYVTNVVLYAPFGQDTVKKLNEWLAVNDPREQQLGYIDPDWITGNKVFEGDLWACAGNYFVIDDFIEQVKTADWDYPEDVVLIHQTEGGPVSVVRAE